MFGVLLVFNELYFLLFLFVFYYVIIINIILKCIFCFKIVLKFNLNLRIYFKIFKFFFKINYGFKLRDYRIWGLIYKLVGFKVCLEVYCVGVGGAVLVYKCVWGIIRFYFFYCIYRFLVGIII